MTKTPRTEHRGFGAALFNARTRWVLPSDDKAVRDLGLEPGTVLEGYLDQVQGVWALVTDVRVKGNRPLCLAAASRPSLQTLVDAEVARRQAREEQLAAEDATRQAADEALRAPMLVEAAEIRRTIPATHVEVEVRRTGSLDGQPTYEYRVGDLKLDWQAVEIVGVAGAVRPGALAPFAEIVVASISTIRLNAIRAEMAEHKGAQADVEARSQAARVAAFARARETGERQRLESGVCDCRAPEIAGIECSADAWTLWAMPDGSETTTYVHTS